MITQVSQITGIPEITILCGSDLKACEVRQLYWKLMRQHGYTYQRIAALSGRKSHTTILLGIKHIDGLIDSDMRVAYLWSKIKEIEK